MAHSYLTEEFRSREKKLHNVTEVKWTGLIYMGHFSGIQLFVIPWTVSCKAPLSMGFSRQEYWSGLPCPPPGDFPDPGIEPMSLMSPALAGGFFTTSATWEATIYESKVYVTVEKLLNLSESQFLDL